MRSLEERKAYRKEQKEEQRRKAALSPTQAKDESENDSDDEFDAEKHVKSNADVVIKSIPDLSPEELAAVEAAEAKGKNRSSVLDAIKTSRNTSNAAASGWGANV